MSFYIQQLQSLEKMLTNKTQRLVIGKEEAGGFVINMDRRVVARQHNQHAYTHTRVELPDKIDLMMKPGEKKR